MRLVVLLASSALLAASEPAVTVYNGGFAVVRDRIAVDLGQGPGVIRYPGASAHVEPGTALIAVPEGVRVLEHTYRNDPVSVARLLQLFAGQTIGIEVQNGDRREVRQARIVRAPATIHQDAWARFGSAYAQRQQSLFEGNGAQGVNEVLLEIDGQLRFGLPGTPLFPALPPGSDLRPTLEWQVRTSQPVKGAGELSYLCGGMRWEAAYTLVVEAGDPAAIGLNGVISVENQCGTDFLQARMKFVAGEVRKLEDEGGGRPRMAWAAKSLGMEPAGIEARAEGRAFSDYHLYALPDPVDVRDRETKQLGFLEARGIPARRRLVYDGLALDWNQFRGWNAQLLRSNREFATASNPKIAVEWVIDNTPGSRLGRPLPAGVVRCYQKDADGQPEFIGETSIDHTPEGETLRLRTGNAFDLVGERTQVDFAHDEARHFCAETYRITVRNHRAAAVEVLVTEHLHRGSTWEIRNPSAPFSKRDSTSIDFPVTVPAKGEATVTYQAYYTW